MQLVNKDFYQEIVPSVFEKMKVGNYRELVNRMLRSPPKLRFIQETDHILLATWQKKGPLTVQQFQEIAMKYKLPWPTFQNDTEIVSTTKTPRTAKSKNSDGSVIIHEEG